MTFITTLLRQREYGLVALILIIGGTVACIDSGFLAAANLKDMIIRCAPTVIGPAE